MFHKSHYPSFRDNLVSKSEVKDRILPDLVRCMAEVEWGLQEMMERLLANQEKMDAKMMAGQAELKEEMKANQEESSANLDVKAEARLKQLDQDSKGHMEALLEGLMSCGKKDDSLPSISVASTEKSNDDPEEMEAVVVLRRAFGQNGGHEFGGKSRSSGGCIGAVGTPSTLGCAASRIEK
jgi:hypothetical protein